MDRQDEQDFVLFFILCTLFIHVPPKSELIPLENKNGIDHHHQRATVPVH